MAKRSQRPDLNQIAAKIVQQTTESYSQAAVGGVVKNPAAVALGRLGGLKGGKARAEALSAKKRSTIAKKAALARWKSKKKGDR